MLSLRRLLSFAIDVFEFNRYHNSARPCRVPCTRSCN